MKDKKIFGKTAEQVIQKIQKYFLNKNHNNEKGDRVITPKLDDRISQQARIWMAFNIHQQYVYVRL